MKIIICGNSLDMGSIHKSDGANSKLSTVCQSKVFVSFTRV